MKGRVNWCSKLHCCLLRNYHSHPNLQQPPPSSVSSHQHLTQDPPAAKRWRPANDGQQFLAIKHFYLRYVHCFRHNAISLNSLQHSVTLTHMCTGKPANPRGLVTLYCWGRSFHSTAEAWDWTCTVSEVLLYSPVLIIKMQETSMNSLNKTLMITFQNMWSLPVFVH